jgi:hypothetical protein
VSPSQFSRAELEDAFGHYCRVNDEASAARDWASWAGKFTEDVHYVEHAFGELHGRAALKDWIERVMAPYPHMDFPMDWHIVDAERGWVVFQCQNRLAHPSEPGGAPFQFPTWSLIHYAGRNLWSYEEDVYNPREASATVRAWVEAGGELRAREIPMQRP